MSRRSAVAGRTLEAYRALVQATSSLVWRWTPDGGTIEGEGWDAPAQFGGDEWLDALHPDDRASADEAWREALSTGAPAQIVYRARTTAGHYRWCVSHAVPLKDAEGRVVEWIGSLVDVHAERAAAESQHRRERLEALGRLTAGVAHDFNNLLTVITAGMETLADGLPPGDPLRSEADLALHAAERGADLVKRLLTVARQQRLSPQTVDVGRTLDALAKLVRRTLGATLELSVRGSPHPLFCRADPAELESALLNLCLNARDAMPEGGKRLETERVAFTRDAAPHLDLQPGRYVMITVRDTGRGMSAETLEHALDPFFTTKPSGAGSGLGLSMAYGFVKQSGGHFAIASKPGRGSTVRLYLPEAPPPRTRAAPPASAGATQVAGAHILLVEDDPLVRDQVARQLGVLGYVVTVAGDVRTAVTLLKSETAFDLLFTDVAMPGGADGRALAAKARRLRPGLPVLFTSGYADDGDLRVAGPAAVHFLPKPYRRQQLDQAVARALRG